MAVLQARCQVPAKAHRARTVRVEAAWKASGVKQSSLSASGGRVVVELDKTRVVLAEWDGQVFATSNKCSHLGLPLVGKTALLQGKVVDKCIVCPAHGTAFDLETGAVKGKWCPSLPEAVSTGFGLTPPKPLPTFPSRVTESGEIEVDI